MSLHDDTIRAALAVPPHGGSVSRSVIDGAVVIYDLDEPPLWLLPVLRARDEDGNTIDGVIVRASAADGVPILMEYCEGTAITGVT